MALVILVLMGLNEISQQLLNGFNVLLRINCHNFDPLTLTRSKFYLVAQMLLGKWKLCSLNISDINIVSTHHTGLFNPHVTE